MNQLFSLLLTQTGGLAALSIFCTAWLRPWGAWSPVGTSDADTPLRLGTGAFSLGEYVAGSHVKLTRYDEWWGGAVPTKNIVFKYEADSEKRASMLLTGEADVGIIDWDNHGSFDDSAYFNAPEILAANPLEITFNYDNEFLGNINLRKAIRTILTLQKGDLYSALEGKLVNEANGFWTLDLVIDDSKPPLTILEGYLNNFIEETGYGFYEDITFDLLVHEADLKIADRIQKFFELLNNELINAADVQGLSVDKDKKYIEVGITSADSDSFDSYLENGELRYGAFGNRSFGN